MRACVHACVCACLRACVYACVSPHVLPSESLWMNRRELYFLWFITYFLWCIVRHSHVFIDSSCGNSNTSSALDKKAGFSLSVDRLLRHSHSYGSRKHIHSPYILFHVAQYKNVGVVFRHHLSCWKRVWPVLRCCRKAVHFPCVGCGRSCRMRLWSAITKVSFFCRISVF